MPELTRKDTLEHERLQRVVCKYTSSTATTSLPSGVRTDLTHFDTSEVDTHSIFNTTTGEITIPRAGLYQLMLATGVPDNSAWGTNEYYVGEIQLDSGSGYNVVVNGFFYKDATSTRNPGTMQLSNLLKLNANDKIKFSIRQYSGVTLTAGGDPGSHYFLIYEVGDYIFKP